MTVPQILKAFDLIVRTVQTGEKASELVVKTAPYCIVKKREPVVYNGLTGWLVWDYLIWNELTFEDRDSGKKYSVLNKFSDEETEKAFDEFVAKYGNHS